MNNSIIISICLFLFSWSSIQTTNAQVLPDIDVSNSEWGIVDLPNTVDQAFLDVFDRYAKITSPGGDPIHIIAQDQVSDLQIIRARNVMRHLLTDFPNSFYGFNKTSVANAMASNEAILAFFNSEAEAELAIQGDLGSMDINIQPLYATECVVEGSEDYLTNDTRDATIEEVLHLVHDYGIIPVLNNYQNDILEAANEAKDAGFWSSPEMNDWIAEGSLAQEYLATIVEVYYDMWKHNADGSGTAFFGEYEPIDRNELLIQDTDGFNNVTNFFHPELTYNAVLDGDFNETFELFLNPEKDYTFKSQYLNHATLTGNTEAGIHGNDNDNNLLGNLANNHFYGEGGDDFFYGNEGTDTVHFRGNFAEYNIFGQSDTLIVDDMLDNRDGFSQLKSIEILVFNDLTAPAISFPTNIEDYLGEGAIKIYPNPIQQHLNIFFENEFDKIAEIRIESVNGKILHQFDYNREGSLKRNVEDLMPGVYFVNAINQRGRSVFIQKVLKL